MKSLFLSLCFWCVCLHGIETDFDCVVVGTSPFSLFEAIYKRSLGNRVAIVEQGAECGGAWKSITICGVPHVDLGCHEFGRDERLIKFLEEYAGCKIVGTASDLQKTLTTDFYPSQGCYELTHNLERLMQSLGVTILLNSKVESVFIDTTRELAEVKINDVRYTTRKLVLTNNSEINFENPQAQNPTHRAHTYYHIGILIEDPTPPRFTYKNFHHNGASRSTNYTPYSKELQGTGKQLITFQVNGEKNLGNAEIYFEELKKQGLLDSQAKLLQVDNYIYKQTPLSQGTIHKMGEPARAMIEVINSGNISYLVNHIDKWKQAMKPFNQIVSPDLSRAAG